MLPVAHAVGIRNDRIGMENQRDQSPDPLYCPAAYVVELIGTDHVILFLDTFNRNIG